MTNNEILLMVDVVCSEKDLDREEVFLALEAALATASRKRHLGDIEARVSIDRETGEYDTFRQWEVIEDDVEMESPDRQIFVADAAKENEGIEAGDFIEEPLAQVPFGRIEAQAAKQVIIQKVREAEREHTVARFSERQGEMVMGTVRRMERGDAIVDIDGSEALLHKSKMIPREPLRTGDRIRAILSEVASSPRGPQLYLDRIDNDLLIKLFRLEVPEIGEGLIEIKGAARDPGSRAKIAVKSLDPKIDPVGACVGIRGSRVQSASNEINGERVDIITWSEEPAQFVIEAIKPAEVDSILVDEENHSMDIVVDESQLSQSIGKGGQNVRLASVLTGWELNIMTEAEATEKLELSAQNLSQRLMEELDIDEDISSILVQEGFSSLEEVAYVPRQELVDIEEFTEELVDELRKRAEDTLLAKAISDQQKLLPAEDLLNMEEVSDELAAKLAANGIRSMEDLAECAVDELLEIEGLGLESEKASVLIMAARAPWFEEADNQDS